MIALYPHQEKAKTKLKKRLTKYSTAFLMAEERFGKTLTILQALEELDVKRVAFITLKAAVPDIINDYELLHPSYPMDCINYESLHKLTKSYDAIVFDESSRLAAFSLKPNQVQQKAHSFIQHNNPCYVLLSNATPSVESYNQFYYPLKIAGFWSEFTKASEWFKVYGIPTKQRIAGGREIQVYNRVKNDLIYNSVSKLLIKGTRKDADFKQHTTRVEFINIQPSKETLDLYNQLKKDKYTKIGDSEVTLDTTSKEMIKLQQLTGGFIYDDEGRTLNLSCEKLDWLAKNVKPTQKVAIYARYTAEIDKLKQLFPQCLTYTQFKEAKQGVFISQIKTGSKGIDLSSATHHYFYSLDFSGETFIQAIARQHNKKRDREVVAHILSLGLIDQEVAEVVTEKKKFNTKLYRKVQY